MSKYIGYSTVAALACIAILALQPRHVAAYGEPLQQHKPLGVVLSNDLNQSAANRTWTLSSRQCQGYTTAAIYVDYDYSQATRVDMQCYASNDNFSTQYSIEQCTVASGVCTSNASAIYRKAVSASDQWVWRLDIGSYQDLRCVMSGVSPGPDDNVSVSVTCAAP